MQKSRFFCNKSCYGQQLLWAPRFTNALLLVEQKIFSNLPLQLDIIDGTLRRAMAFERFVFENGKIIRFSIIFSFRLCIFGTLQQLSV